MLYRVCMSETRKTMQIRKLDEDRHLIYGEVYIPDVVDSQGDYMTGPEIEKMAHRFMREGRVSKVDTNHDLKENGSFVVESFIARTGDPDFMVGSWVLGVHVPDDALWEQVKKGDLNGYSMFGSGHRTPRIVEIDLPDDGILKGETKEADSHSHTYMVKFDNEGGIVGGETNVVNGHKHLITKGTATDEASGHRHRFSYLEVLNESQG